MLIQCEVKLGKLSSLLLIPEKCNIIHPCTFSPLQLFIPKEEILNESQNFNCFERLLLGKIYVSVTSDEKVKRVRVRCSTSTTK